MLASPIDKFWNDNRLFLRLSYKSSLLSESLLLNGDEPYPPDATEVNSTCSAFVVIDPSAVWLLLKCVALFFSYRESVILILLTLNDICQVFPTVSITSESK